jgi:phosphate-selective porin OprO/OprP
MRRLVLLMMMVTALPPVRSEPVEIVDDAPAPIEEKKPTTPSTTNPSLFDHATSVSTPPFAPSPRASADQPTDSLGPTSPAVDLAEPIAHAGAESPGSGEGSPFDFKARWKHGLEAETSDKQFRVHVGGRVQADAVTLNADPSFSQTLPGAGVQDAVSLRRARLRVDGRMFGFIDWATEFDFVNSVNSNAGLVGGLPGQPATEANTIDVPAPTDVWVNLGQIPWVQNIRIGNHKEPIGLEHMTSSRFLDYMERSFLQDAYFGPFNNGFTPGISIFGNKFEERATYAVGFFRNTQNVFAYGIGDGEWAGTGRLTFLPYYDEKTEGSRLIHLGAACSVREPDTGQARIRSRASLRNGPGSLNTPYADTGFFLTSRQDIATAEAIAMFGPLIFQGEYVASWNRDCQLTGTGPDLGTFFSTGYYAEVLYFLTGEHREYEKEFGVFGRVIPRRNFFVKDERGCRRGLGAWQIATRYSMLDLRSNGIDGGVLQDITLGLNWFLNPNMKFQFNYIFMNRNAPDILGPVADGWVNGFGARWAMDF